MSSTERGGRTTRRRIVLALAILLAAAAALVDVTIVEPRIHVRWADGLDAAERAALEARYRLRAGQPVVGSTWRYDLLDRSPENVGALVADRAVADTEYIDRSTLAVADRDIRVTFDRVSYLFGANPAQLIQLQSVLLFVAGVVMVWAAGAGQARSRHRIAVAVLALVAVAAYAVPLRQPIRMGDSETYVETRNQFENYSGVSHIRFEAHLSHAVLGRLDAMLGRTAQSPRQALDLLMRGATAWFVLSALFIGALERWSPQVVRYLGLVLLAPSTLLYFGYRELGHLSLNLAVFPLIARGVVQQSRRLEMGGWLAGFSAAWHGFGLLTLAGAGLTALAARLPLVGRIHVAARITLWGIIGYLGWVAVYAVWLNLSLSAGHAESIPMRPWLADVVADRVNAAVLSRIGLRDLFFSAWMVGAPIAALMVGLRRQWPEEVRMALIFTIPSALFLVVFWPIQGIGVEMDLVFAAFPAMYALLWVCAHDQRRTWFAAALLISAHVAFWRVVLGTDFVNSRIG